MNTTHQVLIFNLTALFQIDIFGNGGIPEEMIQMEEAQPRIVGGYEVQDMSKFGYQVQYGSKCGGAILGSKWVISAAHCGEQGYVRVGSKLFDKGTKYNVAKYVFHPDWLRTKKPHKNEMDMVLLQLETQLTFSNNVYAIKIGTVRQLKVGLMLTVSGWGIVRYGTNIISDSLRAVDLPVVAQSLCQKVPLPKYINLTDNMFCAGYKGGFKDSCEGDSGAPAVNNKRLFGLASFGDVKCGSPNSYGVYTKIGKVIPWIQKVTKLTVI